MSSKKNAQVTFSKSQGIYYSDTTFIEIVQKFLKLAVGKKKPVHIYLYRNKILI